MDRSNKKKILIIHHADYRIEHLRQSLAHYPYDVMTTLNGNQGFELAKKEQPDIIIATAKLNGTDGFNLCWMIRQTPELATTPYLLITDRHNSEERINAYRSGVDAFISAETSIREIYTLIETILRRTKQMKDANKLPDHSLQGKLPHFSVVEILQMLNISKKNGTLVLFHQNKKGEISFQNGNLVWAKLGQRLGEDAVKEFVFWNDGHFIFEKDQVSAEKNIQTPTMQLILDCCQLLDENNNASLLKR